MKHKKEKQFSFHSSQLLRIKNKTRAEGKKENRIKAYDKITE